MTVLWRTLRHGEGMAGAVLLAILAGMALAAPIVFPRDPMAIVGPPLLTPFQDWSHLFGTDRLGRDVMAGIFHGTRTSLAIGLAAAASAICLGLVVGTIAGFGGKWLDEALMRVTDAFQTVPGFLLALAMVSLLSPSFTSVVAAIALGAWPSPARMVRAQVLSIRERDYVAAARAIGMRPAGIAFREILPNALPPVLSLVSIIVAGAMLIEASLSFLGLGDPNRVTWGGMIAEGRAVLRSAPYLSIIPGLALVASVLAVYLLGEAYVEASAVRESERT